MGEIIATFVVDHFWLIMLLTFMLTNKKYRIFGIILATFQIAFGFVTWLAIAVVVIAVITDIVRWQVLGWMRIDDRKPHPPKSQPSA